MTLDQSKTSSDIDTDVTRRFDSLMLLNTAVMNGYIKAFHGCMQGVLGLHQEFVRFAAKRVECDLDMAQSFARCRGWTDATRIQRDWSREAAEDYAAESSKVLQFASQAASENVESLRQQAVATLREREAA